MTATIEIRPNTEVTGITIARGNGVSVIIGASVVCTYSPVRNIKRLKVIFTQRSV